jgi:hypothetical protein
MAEAIWETLKQYGLIGKVSLFKLCQLLMLFIYSFAKIMALMMDNVTNNDMLALGIEWHSKEAGYHFSAMDSRMHCMPHTVHLTAIKVCVYFSWKHTLINVCPIAS